MLSEFVKHLTSAGQSTEVRKLLDQSWKGISRSAEVPALKAYLQDPGVGVSFLNATLAPLLSTSGFQVKFAGVFCHKKPTVTRTALDRARNPGDTPGCELGDLLTLFVLLDGADRLQYLAGSLFQAKVEPKLDSASQRHLYDDDAGFTLPKYLGGHHREMPTYEEGRGRALRYLILRPHRANPYIACRHTPWDAAYNPRWSTYVYNLLAGNDGLVARTRTGIRNKAWNTIVDDLLGVAAEVPAKKPPRGNDVAIQVATGQFNDFGSMDVQHIESNQPGVSVLFAIVQGQGAG
jgi:hypothetical protein